jgi:hypothetical protein
MMAARFIPTRNKTKNQNIKDTEIAPAPKVAQR